MAVMNRATEGDLAGPAERKADRLPLRTAAFVLPVLSLVGWVLLIFLGLVLWSALG
jgi:hypothetical protein